MSAAQTGNFLELLAGIAILVWIIYGPWRRFIIDVARQNLFEIRDAVFMLAAEGKVAFDDPAYIAFRDRINCMIRFCEHYSLVVLFATPSAPESKGQSFADLLESMADKSIANRIKRDYHIATSILVASMVFRSVFWTALIMPMLPFFAVREMLSGIRHTRGFVGRIERKVDCDISAGIRAAV